MKIFNSLSGKKETLVPIEDNNIRMYVCGMTVYDDTHIGHARTFVSFDLIVRYLRDLGYEVQYIRNITDVDDKIISRAKELGWDPSELVKKYISSMDEDFSALGMIKPDQEPRATDNIDSIIRLIEILIDKGHAYEGESDVYFSTESFESYGKLSKRKVEDMLAGARIDVDLDKKNPADFVLWKKDTEGLKWDSPWGPGRPGWHIECTSMIKDILGDDTTLDIHGGGNDLIFPHHENEIAQGSCISKEKYCNHWFHNGIVLVEKKKMSKSLGNVILLDDLLRKHSRSVIRLALLSAHYRQPLNWSNQTLDNAKNLYKKLLSVIDLEDGSQSVIHDEHDSYSQCSEIQDILCDDLNTPEAINYLSRLSKTARNDTEDRTKLMHSMKFIGLAPFNEKSIKPFLNEQKIEELIQKRNEYRIKKDFKNADAVRDKLLAMGVELKDLDDNTTWNYSQD